MTTIEGDVTAYFIAIDNGSQSTKVSLIDQSGTVHARAQVPLRQYSSPSPGHWEHPDDDLWESVVKASTLALGRFAGDRTRIVGVGLCTIRFCRAVLREDGTLAQPVMSWMDERVASPWVRESDDARHVTTSSGYITHRLTGKFRDSAGNYQGAWPIDTSSWAWAEDEQQLEAHGIPRNMLMELVVPGAELGRVTGQAAAATGIPEGLPVIATSNDKAVEALGCGLRDDTTVLVSLGTYITGMMTGDRNVPADDAYWVNFASVPKRYLYESGGIRRGMWTVSWFRDLVYGNVDTSDTAVREEELNAGAAEIRAGSGGLVTVLDWLAPSEQLHRRGALLGFDGTQGRFHIYRSILEAVAITMHGNCRRMAAGLERDISEVVVSGGGSASDLMMSVLASVFGVSTRRPAVTDAAGLGAAICASVGTGVHPTWDAAIDAMVRTDATFAPDPGLVAEYERVSRRYEHVVPRAAGLFLDAP